MILQASLVASINFKISIFLGILCVVALLVTYTSRPRLSKPLLSDDDGIHADVGNSLLGSARCLGAPFLYVTVHDKVPNVLKYTRDGCFVSDNVLMTGDVFKGDNDVEFRSMAIGKHKDHDALFIADASNYNSRLLIFGKCVEDANNYGRRPYIETVVQSTQNVGVDHTYGVCLDKSGNVYISNQHTDCVLRFQVGNFRPMNLPRSLQLDHRLDYYDGTFVQFGLPREHGTEEQGIRAIVNVKSKIWIAHEDLSGVAIADIDSGLVTEVVSLDTAVGLHYDEDLEIVFVSCKSSKRGGIVYALDPESFKVIRSYRHHKMAHPTGQSACYVHHSILWNFLACLCLLMVIRTEILRTLSKLPCIVILILNIFFTFFSSL